MQLISSPSSARPSSSSAVAIAAAAAVLDAVVGAETPAPTAVVATILAAGLPEIPGADRASVTLLAKHLFVTVAASDDVARQADDAQYALGTGPCLTAVGGETVAADEATLRARWPVFASRASTVTPPVRSVLSQPLTSVTAFGSLNVYSDRPDGFDQTARAAAADVAAVCGLALVAVQQRVRAENLTLALESNRRIGAAVGVVMALSRCTDEQAFEIIRIASQRTHRKVRDVAEEILFTGTVPDI